MGRQAIVIYQNKSSHKGDTSIMEVINVYPEYDGEGYDCEGYDGTDIHKYTFPHRKTYDVEADKASDSGQDVYTDEMRFNSLADYEDFLIWGTDYRDQYF